MSGGHFDYDQYRINEIACQLKEDILFMKDKYEENTIKEFKEAYKLLKKAAVYVERIDYLLSGDDGEDNFHERLAEDLGKEIKQFDLPCLTKKCEYCSHYYKNLSKDEQPHVTHWVPNFELHDEKLHCDMMRDNAAYGGYSLAEWKERQKEFEDTNAVGCWDFEPSEKVKEQYLGYEE